MDFFLSKRIPGYKSEGVEEEEQKNEPVAQTTDYLFFPPEIPEEVGVLNNFYDPPLQNIPLPSAYYDGIPNFEENIGNSNPPEISEEKIVNEEMRRTIIQKNKEYEEKKNQIMKEKTDFLPVIEVVMDTNGLLDAEIEDIVKLFFGKPFLRKCHIPYTVIDELDGFAKRMKNSGNNTKFLRCKAISILLKEAEEEERNSIVVVQEPKHNQMRIVIDRKRNDDLIYDLCKDLADEKMLNSRRSSESYVFILITNDRNLQIKVNSLKEKKFTHCPSVSALWDTVDEMLREKRE